MSISSVTQLSSSLYSTVASYYMNAHSSKASSSLGASSSVRSAQGLVDTFSLTSLGGVSTPMSSLYEALQMQADTPAILASLRATYAPAASSQASQTDETGETEDSEDTDDTAASVESQILSGLSPSGSSSTGSTSAAGQIVDLMA